MLSKGMCYSDESSCFFSSSSFKGTPVVNAYELKARGKGVEGGDAAEDSRSVSSKQNATPESSPLEISDEHVSAFEHNHLVAPEPRVNYL